MGLFVTLLHQQDICFVALLRQQDVYAKMRVPSRSSGSRPVVKMGATRPPYRSSSRQWNNDMDCCVAPTKCVEGCPLVSEVQQHFRERPRPGGSEHARFYCSYGRPRFIKKIRPPTMP